MEQLKNILINSTLLKLEKDLAYVEMMMREKKDVVDKIVGLKRLSKEVNFVRKIKGSDIMTSEPWTPDSDIRVRLNIFYLFYYMLKEKEAAK